MGSIPVWMWPNAAMLTAVGVYLWWRLVVGTTHQGQLRPPHRHRGRRHRGAARPVDADRSVRPADDGATGIAWPGWLAYGLIVFLATATLLTEPVRIFWWFRRGRARLPAKRAADKLFAQEFPVADKPFAQEDRSPHRSHRIGGCSCTGRWPSGSAVSAPLSPGSRPARRRRDRTFAGWRSHPRPSPERGRDAVALVSDLHLGCVMRRDFCRSVVDLVNAQQPDLVLLVGDLTDGRWPARRGPAPLSELRSTEGTFFVTGNHEFYFDPDGWLDVHPAARHHGAGQRGRSSAACCWPECRTSRADRAGAVPTWTPRCRPARARPTGDHDEPLAEPGYDAIDRDVELMVSGHTHGGQFYPAAFHGGATNPALTGLQWIDDRRSTSPTGRVSGDRSPGWVRRRTSR